MSKNVTIRLDEAIVKKCRHAAVEEDKSLSQWIADQLALAVSSVDARSSARKRAIQRLADGVPMGGVPLSRDETHDR